MREICFFFLDVGWNLFPYGSNFACLMVAILVPLSLSKSVL